MGCTQALCLIFTVQSYGAAFGQCTVDYIVAPMEV